MTTQTNEPAGRFAPMQGHAATLFNEIASDAYAVEHLITTLITFAREDDAPQLLAIRSLVQHIGHTADMASDAMGGCVVRDPQAWLYQGLVLEAAKAIGAVDEAA